ncbi:DUF3847 domain-containing protein [Bengtsoniella intestinalis]|uniref:DUF3847 domain-containing protein n=1 Tax=Bengtsoniella intestinalis TaxID=3073143 RepID=UPI00391F258F
MKTLEEIRKEEEAAQLKLTQYKHKLDRLRQRVKYYEEGDRKKRVHRLITKGAAIESIAPSTVHLSEQDFYALMNHILSHPSVIPLLPQEET